MKPFTPKNLKLNSMDEVSPFMLFEKFFDSHVVDFIVDMTNLYARRDKGKPSFETNSSEIRVFLAMLILSGYTVLPRRKLYWENSDDVFIKAMSDAMSRNRFEELISVLHLSDNNNLRAGDKMAKIRPFYDMLNIRCRNYAPNKDNKSVDEAMIPYFGRNSSKQRMQNKPVRVGYKQWVLAETSGYVIQFDPYQGVKNGNACRSSSTTWGLGESVVLSLAESLPKDGAQHIFIDNFFTSFRLLKHLSAHGIAATGTIRQNKLNQCSIIDANLLKKKGSWLF